MESDWGLHVEFGVRWKRFGGVQWGWGRRRWGCNWVLVRCTWAGVSWGGRTGNRRKGLGRDALKTGGCIGVSGVIWSF